jgi:hypothetical protein
MLYGPCSAPNRDFRFSTPRLISPDIGSRLPGFRILTNMRAPIDTRGEIARLRAEGLSWHKVAASLNTRAIPTPSGYGQWWASSAQRHADPTGWARWIREYRRR